MKNSCSIEVYLTLPLGFCPQVQVAACYLEVNNQILLFQKIYLFIFSSDEHNRPTS